MRGGVEVAEFTAVRMWLESTGSSVKVTCGTRRGALPSSTVISTRSMVDDGMVWMESAEVTSESGVVASARLETRVAMERGTSSMP